MDKHYTYRYFISDKEREKIYYKLYNMGVTPTKYAKQNDIEPSYFCKILNGKSPLTPLMYTKAFKDFDCLSNVPEEFEV